MRWRHICAVVASMIATIAIVATAGAAIINVTTFTDENDGFMGGGSGISLREAVLYSLAGDVVQLPMGIYALPLGQMTLTHGTTIFGPAGGQATIDCLMATRAFSVSANAYLKMRNVRIMNGRTPGFSSGGAIESFALVDVLDCTFENNAATADGGAIVSNGTAVMITSCTFINNHANYDGGGLRNNSGQATVTNSTFTLGSTGFSGAALRNVSGTPMQVNHCTMVNNHANFNGGAVEGQMAAQNTIFFGNTAANAGPDIFGSFTSLGRNLIGNPASAAGMVATDLVAVNPMLAALAGNGGATETMALLPGSPAVDYVPASVLSSDQRGIPRPQGGGFDIGAFELEGATPAHRSSWGRLKTLYR